MSHATCISLVEAVIPPSLSFGENLLPQEGLLLQRTHRVSFSADAGHQLYLPGAWLFALLPSSPCFFQGVTSQLSSLPPPHSLLQTPTGSSFLLPAELLLHIWSLRPLKKVNQPIWFTATGTRNGLVGLSPLSQEEFEALDQKEKDRKVSCLQPATKHSTSNQWLKKMGKDLKT